MAPINVVIVVVTVIEALRAFDIVYIINRGKNGLELLSTLITNNGISESNRVGFASSIAVVLLLISLGADHRVPGPDDAGGAAMTAAATPGCLERSPAAPPATDRAYAFLTFMAVTWLFPLLWAAYTALRPYADTLANGYISIATTLNFDNFVDALHPGPVPDVLPELADHRRPGRHRHVAGLASMVAFAVSRFRWRFNLFS